MAAPQLEDGHVQISIELLAPLMGCGFGQYELILLAEVLMVCYGPPPKPDRVCLPIHDIARHTGIASWNLNRALRDLVEAKILIPNGDGSHSFNKDYDTWIPRGTPIIERLKGGVIRWTKSCVLRFGLRTKPAPRRKVLAFDIDPVEDDPPTTSGPDATGDEPIHPQRKPRPEPRAMPPEPRPQATNQLRIAAESTKTPNRDPQDEADFQAAMNMLFTNLRTERVSHRLQTESHSKEVLAVPGWKWLHAARVLTDSTNNLTEGQRESWGYYTSIARNAKASEVEAYGKVKSRQDRGGRAGEKDQTVSVAAADWMMYADPPQPQLPKETA